MIKIVQSHIDGIPTKRYAYRNLKLPSQDPEECGIATNDKGSVYDPLPSEDFKANAP